MRSVTAAVIFVGLASFTGLAALAQPQPAVTSDPKVAQAQIYLIELGIYHGEADGTLGPGTWQALGAFKVLAGWATVDSVGLTDLVLVQLRQAANQKRNEKQ
jgi:hypothetical protein